MRIRVHMRWCAFGCGEASSSFEAFRVQLPRVDVHAPHIDLHELTHDLDALIHGLGSTSSSPSTSSRHPVARRTPWPV